MKEREVKETKEVNEVREESGEVAAFFDLDGTLMGLPSLEKRFFSMLRYRKLIGIRNCVSWLMETVRLLPLGLNHVMHANKMYLRGVRLDAEAGGADIPVCLGVEDGAAMDRKRRKGKNREGRRPARMPVPLYPEAIERVVWHAERGHLIVIVSGTLEMLAARAARELEAALGERGLTCTIRVCATRLEQKDERWTGRIVGQAMFGETKALAIRRVAAEEDLDLLRCFAYGDSSSDLWMLESAGKPAAVNPSNDLVRIARRNHWPVLRWGEQKNFAQRTRRAQSAQRSEESDERLAVGHAKSGYGT
jgi:HAD superfamily phosphoserine phosphatase-like hydrolase